MTAAPDRSRMRLLAWLPVNKGALVGKAKVLLPIGLEISDIAIFEKDGRRWAQFPSEIMRDPEGKPLTGDNGKVKYKTSIRWATRDLHERFSAALIALVESSTEAASEPHREAPSAGSTRPRTLAPHNAYARYRRVAEPVGADGGRPFDDPVDDIGFAR